MKKIFLLLLLVLSISCKNENKEKETKQIAETPKKETLKEVAMVDLSTWGKVNVEVKEAEETLLGEQSVLLSRIDSYENFAFAHSRKINISYLNRYKFSVKAKKGQQGHLLGLRILGNYPDRVDAVFNLSNGQVVGVQKSRDFEEEKATIEPLENGWYKCSVIVDAAADNVSLIFGPTNDSKSINGWEAKTDKNNDIYILPSSLFLEEVTFE